MTAAHIATEQLPLLEGEEEGRDGPIVRVRVPPKGHSLISNGEFLLDPFPSAEVLAAVDRAGRESDDAGAWFDVPEGSIVLDEQPATSIYRNDAGSAVIRQRSWSDDDDPFVIITAESLPKVIDALRKFVEGAQ